MCIYYRIFCMFEIMHNFDKHCSSQGFPESLLLALSVVPGEISTINSASNSGCDIWVGLLLFPNLFSLIPSTGPESGTNRHATPHGRESGRGRGQRYLDRLREASWQRQSFGRIQENRQVGTCREEGAFPGGDCLQNRGTWRGKRRTPALTLL